MSQITTPMENLELKKLDSQIVFGSEDEAGTVVCHITGPEGGEAWKTFANGQAAANLGHLWEWRAVNERAYRKRCYYVMATIEGETEGILPLVHMKGILTGNRLVSLPFLDQAGILARTTDASNALRVAAASLASKLGARGFDLREDSTKGGEAERVTLVLPLAKSAETLWKSFKPKVRNQVRKAEKSGLRTQCYPAERVDDFYPVFARNMRDLGSPVHSKHFLREVMQAFGSRSRLYLTEEADANVVGGAIAIRSGKTVTVPWASSLREFFSSCPNHSLYWKILEETVEEGAEVFDFGRSYVDSGTYRFKKQWGAQIKGLTWSAFDADGRPEETRAYKPSDHRWITDTWSKLPLLVANLFGPVIRRQLAN